MVQLDTGATAESRPIAPPAYDARLVRRLWAFIRPHQRLLWSSLGFLILSQACSLALPLLVMEALDGPLTDGELDGLWPLLWGYGGITVVLIASQSAYTWTVDKTGQNALLDLRMAVFEHLQRLNASFYDKTPIGRLVGRVTTDVEALQEMFSSGVVTILGDLLFLIATLVILFSIQPELSLVTVAVVPILVALTLWIRIRVRAAYEVMISRRSRLNAFLHEHVSGMPLIQAFVRERRTAQEFQATNGEMRDAQLRSVKWESSLSGLTEMFGSFTTAMIVWYGGGVVVGDIGVEGGLTLGKLFLFITLMDRFFGPLNELSLKYTVMQNAMTASDRIFALLDRTEITEEPGAPKDPATAEGRIRFRDVVFGYDPDEPVLHGLDFEVAPGERVAVVGATGAGKTTILKLLTRLYDVQSGSIELDGVDVREYSLAGLRGRVGIVPQDVFLFGGDILSNVRLGHPEITDEEAMEAAGRLHLDDVVERFPRGYREPVRERGKNLSSGERQLVAFARVLAVAPPVLALDEATSNVDSHTEHLLQDAVHLLTEGRTSIVIAHRLSTIRDVDRILVLHKGELVEDGSHDELLAEDGVYRKLYELQYQDQEEREA